MLFRKKSKGYEKINVRVTGGIESTRLTGVIGQTIRCKGIQAGTENAKVMNDEDWIHYNW